MARRPIKLNFTDDGDAFIPASEIEALTTPYEKRIRELEFALAVANNAQAVRENEWNVIRGVVSEKDYYEPAFNKLDRSRQWLEKTIVEMQDVLGINGQLTSAEAIELIDKEFGPAFYETFEKQFPGIDLEEAMEMKDSKYHLRRALENTAERNNIRPKRDLSGKFAERLNPEQFVWGNVSDEQVDKLMNELEAEAEELADPIKMNHYSE